MASTVHLLKLSVGTEGVDDLAAWQKSQPARNAAAGYGPLITHTTRMWPRREAEVLDGGSIYWVIRGIVQCRQRILRLEERRGADGIRRCAIVLDAKLIRTVPQPRRPFQGWRYLPATDVPADLGPYREGEEALPPALASELSALGVL